MTATNEALEIGFAFLREHCSFYKGTTDVAACSSPSLAQWQDFAAKLGAIAATEHEADPALGMSTCDRCGKKFPTAKPGVIHKCTCTGGMMVPDASPVSQEFLIETGCDYLRDDENPFVPGQRWRVEGGLWVQFFNYCGELLADFQGQDGGFIPADTYKIKGMF